AITGAHIAPNSLDFSRLSVPTAPGAGEVLSFDGQGLVWTTPSGGSGSGIVSHDTTLKGNGGGNSPLGLSIPISYSASSSSPLWYFSNSSNGTAVRGDSVG